MLVINTVLLLAASIETRQFDIAASYLAEDFTFEELGLFQPDRKTYLALLQALTVALPDWKLNLRNVQASEGGARATIKFKGSHTGIFIFPDMPVLNPTGKNINMGEKVIEIGVKQNMVISARIIAGAGLSGLLRQMGLQAH